MMLESQELEIYQCVKKELVKMKVSENREEIFTMREYKTNYVGNNDNRSRYNNWRNSLDSRGYVRSRSNPKFLGQGQIITI